jgi:hypothetical protein
VVVVGMLEKEDGEVGWGGVGFGFGFEFWWGADTLLLDVKTAFLLSSHIVTIWMFRRER